MRQSTSFSALLLALFWCCNLAAQTHTIDVIHLKNGTVYKGIIIENIPDEKLKLQTNDGVFVILQSEISTITQEESKKKIKPLREQQQEKEVKDRTQNSGIWEPVKSGYFFQTQLCGEFAGGGIRFVNGYKFNRFVYLGFATGVEFLSFSVNEILFEGYLSEGLHLPLLLHFSGNILNRNKTPVYFVEAGYDLAFLSNYKTLQGLNTTAGIGFKVYGGNKFTFSLLPNIAIRYLVGTEKKEVNGEDKTIVLKGLNFYLGLRLCFGFN